LTLGVLLRFSRVGEILKYSFPILVGLGLVASRAPLGWLTLWAVLANLVIFVFIHMVNDLEDAGDDARDPVKAARNPVASGELPRRTAARVVLVTGAAGALMLAPFPPAAAGVGLTVILLGSLYSWRPVRLKSVPVADLITHGYAGAAGQILFFAFLDGATRDITTLLIAAGAFVFSMGGDLYNEIRDWDVDRDVGLANTAGVLGYERAKLLMIGCYAVGVLTVGGACAFLFDVMGRLRS
jgi:4-hydroxybenzoate polyprenyltransferase